MSFVDEYSICFDSEDENKLEYTSIHDVRILAALHTFPKVIQKDRRWAAMRAHGRTGDHVRAISWGMWQGVDWPEASENCRPDHGCWGLLNFQKTHGQAKRWTQCWGVKDDALERKGKLAKERARRKVENRSWREEEERDRGLEEVTVVNC